MHTIEYTSESDPLADLFGDEGEESNDMSKKKNVKGTAAKPKAAKPPKPAKAGEREARGIPGLNLTAALRDYFANPKGKTSAEAVQHVLTLTKGSKAASGGAYTEAHAVDRVKKVLLGMGKSGKLKTGEQTKEGADRFIYTGGPVLRKPKAAPKSPPKAPAAPATGGLKPRARKPGKAVTAAGTAEYVPPPATESGGAEAADLLAGL